MTGIFHKEKEVKKDYPVVAKKEEKEPVRKRMKNNPIIYRILYQRMCEFNGKEITIKDFKIILNYFRVPVKSWFIIIDDLKSMYNIKYIRNQKIILRER